MLEFLFGKKEQETARDVNLNKIYDELKKAYPFDSIPELRKKYLSMHIQKYGYLTYSFQKAQEELTNEETLFALEEKWKQNNVFKNGKFSYRQNQISVLARHQEKNSDCGLHQAHVHRAHHRLVGQHRRQPLERRQGDGLLVHALQHRRRVG